MMMIMMMMTYKYVYILPDTNAIEFSIILLIHIKAEKIITYHASPNMHKC